jgi:serine phosphatase RsbU (regulator of sigma subunit)
MIGNDMLNHIVLEKKVTSPSLILSDLHTQVSTALRQSETQNRDGMDMSLCVYNKTTKELSFAGAKNPLYYIQNGELKDIAGSKFPIGGRWREGTERIYEAHTLQIDKPTTFFLCTDGYQDQFGGNENRKFYSKNLRNLLFKIHKKPMSKQRTRLKMTFIEWCDFAKQTDDVTIVGIKIDSAQEQKIIGELESERIIQKIVEETKHIEA